MLEIGYTAEIHFLFNNKLLWPITFWQEKQTQANSVRKIELDWSRGIRDIVRAVNDILFIVMVTLTLYKGWVWLTQRNSSYCAETKPGRTAL